MVETVRTYQHQWPITETKEVKWLKHYSSDHQILLVGEGDFSFSLSLGLAFGDASNIVATSLDSFDLVMKKYKGAKRNLDILYSLGAQLLHGVDAFRMKLHTDLQMRKFDRIIYNFPHAGFHGNEDNQRMIMMHRNLVCGFFKNASGMLRPEGEVHVAHKTSHPYQSWNIEELATQNSLRLLECIKFRLEDYPGYNNKRGDGKRSDQPFHLGECSTYKFVLSLKAKKPTTSCQRSPHQPQEISSQTLQISMAKNPAPVFNSSECFQVFKEYFDHALSTFGHVDEHIFRSVPHLLEIGFERCKANIHVDPLNAYTYLLTELQHMSKQRLLFLQNHLLEADHQYQYGF
uniref:heavy metal-associated isoprenylated plant protein 41-like n=1 Tax=Erigeron canadensis TaxID=72917 RepID=UPI001CB9A36B|nr:heavy metal-associated isoprenylated plant protein 41-like [Erigeron canadensis]